MARVARGGSQTALCVGCATEDVIIEHGNRSSRSTRLQARRPLPEAGACLTARHVRGTERATILSRLSESDPKGRRPVPEWWGLHVEGELVQIIHWREASRPTLSDFSAIVPSGVEYEIAPLHMAPGD